MMTDGLSYEAALEAFSDQSLFENKTRAFARGLRRWRARSCRDSENRAVATTLSGTWRRSHSIRRGQNLLRTVIS